MLGQVRLCYVPFSTYFKVEVNNNPTLTLHKNINIWCKLLLDNNYIDLKSYESLICHNGNCSRIYGLINLHKDNHPLRTVVSNVGSPTNSLASFISKILNPLKATSNRLVKGSFTLVQFIDKFSINNTDVDKLVSFDVIFLFTNTPSKLA